MDNYDTIQELKSIFPQFDLEVIESVLVTSNGDREMAINALLSLGSDNPSVLLS